MNRLFATYSGLNRSIYFLFLAQIVNSLGHFVHPFLTLFLTQKMGMSATEAGVYVYISAFVWVPGSMIGGRIADKRARKATMLTFQSLAAATLLPCGFLGTSIAVPWLLILSSFFQGIAEPVNDAMITDMTVADQRKSAFSLLYLGHNIGFALGPVIAGFLFNRYMRWIFFGDAATTAVALVVVAIFTRESKPTEEQIEESFAHDETPEKAEHGSVWRVLRHRPFLVAFMFIHVLYSLVYSQVGFALPLQLSATFGEAGPRYFGIIMTVNAVAVTLFTTFVLNATRKIPPVLTVAISGLFFAVGFGLLHRFDSFAVLIGLTLLWTIGEILGATNASAYVANHAPITHRARVNAIAPIIMYSGQAFGPPLAGLFIDRFSVAGIWPVTLVLSIAGAGLLLLLFLFERRKAVRRRGGSHAASRTSRGVDGSAAVPPKTEQPSQE